MLTSPDEGVQAPERPRTPWFARLRIRTRRGPWRGGSGRSRPTVARVADAALDALVAAMAVWTVAYHVCLVARIPSGWPALVEVLALPGCVWWGWRCSRPEPDERVDLPVRRWHGLRLRQAAGEPGRFARAAARARPALFGVSVVTGAQAAVLFALNAEPWWATWALWVCATVAAVAGALAPVSQPGTQPASQSMSQGAGTQPVDGPAPEDTVRSPRRRAPGTWVACAWAGALGAFSLFLNRADGDDSYYVNMAIWVAKHGTFPLRDTVMSDGVLPAPYWPPVGGYDALLGTVSRFSSVQVPNLVYFVVPPLATALAVLALWRLLRAWRVPAVGVALTFPLLYLLWDGAFNTALGNLFVGRIWQDKALLLWLIVPLMLYHFQRFARRPAPGRLVPLVAVGVAGVGVSTNAMTLLPLVAVAGAVAVLRRGTVRAALWGFAAAAAYPLAAAAVTVAVGGYTPGGDAAQATHLDSPWMVHSVLGNGLRGGVAFGCVLVGVWFVRRPAARLHVAAATLLMAALFAPGVPAFVFELTGLGRTLHRIVWTLPVAALLGVVAAQATTLRAHVTARYGLPAVLATAVVLTGLPLWSPANRTARLTAVPEWKLTSNTWATTRVIDERTPPGDTVLVPRDAGFTIATIDRPVRLVLAREFFARPYDVPGFHARQRLLLKNFANGELPRDRYGEVPAALRAVGVDTACVARPDRDAARLLTANGYGPSRHISHLRCFAHR